MTAPLILTLKLDAASFRFFDDLRRKHFPPEKNFLRAHLTLFHRLPGEEVKKIRVDLAEFCAARKTFALAFPAVRFLGKGVAVKVEASQLIAVHGQLSKLWNDWLTAQDSQKIQPHVTIQNKVAPDAAKELYEKLAADWRAFGGRAEGLQLWHYLGGAWKLEQDFLFAE